MQCIVLSFNVTPKRRVTTGVDKVMQAMCFSLVPAVGSQRIKRIQYIKTHLEVVSSQAVAE